MKTSQDIHDMIQTFDLGASPELLASRILDILDAMNRRMDSIESTRNFSSEDEKFLRKQFPDAEIRNGEIAMVWRIR